MISKDDILQDCTSDFPEHLIHLQDAHHPGNIVFYDWVVPYLCAHYQDNPQNWAREKAVKVFARDASITLSLSSRLKQHLKGFLLCQRTLDDFLIYNLTVLFPKLSETKLNKLADSYLRNLPVLKD